MNERTKIILAQALSLPREQRKELCRSLAKSLGKPEPGFEEGWLDEAEDRLAAYDRGEIASVTLDELECFRKSVKRFSDKKHEKTKT